MIYFFVDIQFQCMALVIAKKYIKQKVISRNVLEENPLALSRKRVTMAVGNKERPLRKCVILGLQTDVSVLFTNTRTSS